MDPLSILKFLASQFTLYQFVLVAIILVIVIAGTVIFISRRTGTSIAEIISKSTKDPVMEKISSLNKDIIDTSSKMITETASISQQIKDFHEYTTQLEQLIRKYGSDTTSVKRELNILLTTLTAELNDIKHHLKLHDNANAASFDVIKTSISNSEQTIKMAVIKIEKLDDYARGAFPEFKSYHRDLDSSLRQIQLDIAVVSNLIKISNSSGPTLR